tara:strand:- start:320 stop:964 length:645 start_codon:yes stop_codon:yes gene_type:complete
MAIIQTPADSGNGGGFTSAQGAISPPGIVTSMLTQFIISDFFDYSTVNYHPNTHASAADPASNGVGHNVFAASTGGNNYAFHTGHNGNSSHWPCYMAIKLTDHYNGMIVNRCYWSKHTNAIGNVDFWGTMKDVGDHTGSSWYNTANYTNIGRAHFGGQGSGNERGTVTGSFNSSSYGYKWLLLVMQDTATSLSSYPNVGQLTGWAMYGLQIGKA